jgi:hypothetical protein
MPLEEIHIARVTPLTAVEYGDTDNHEYEQLLRKAKRPEGWE